MIAIISDIHSNLDALQAVLADIAEQGAQRILCLGDVIGYGPQPKECLDLIMARCAVCLMGNHDYAVLYEPSNFNIGAESACYWTRAQLEAEPDAALRNRRWDFLGQLPVKHTLPAEENDGLEITLVHGSPRRPINEYIFPDDVYTNPGKIHGQFDRFGKLCFVGHTHVPGVFFDTPDFYSTDEMDEVYEISENYKALINVGSVGQPRDRDSRASYGLVDLEAREVRFRRIAYDVDAVIGKIRAVAELDEYLGSRLREGR